MAGYIGGKNGNSVYRNVKSTLEELKFTATAGQVVLDCTNQLANSAVEVYLNGVRLRKNDDYVVGETIITMNSPSLAGEEIIVVLQDGNLPQDNTYSKQEIDQGTVAITSSRGAAFIPSGASYERPSNAVIGQLRNNQDTDSFERYDGNQWMRVGGATGGAGNAMFYESDQIMTEDYTISAGKNALTSEFTVADGVTLTVPVGSILTVV